MKEEDKRLDLEERKRQLYVAMTRAENRLIMTGIDEGKKDKTLDELSWLKQLLQIYSNDNVVEIKPLIVQEKDDKEQELMPTPAVSAEQLEQIAPLPASSENGRLSFSPSSLQTYLHCPRQYFYQYVMGLPPVDLPVNIPITGSLSAKDLGSIVHRALELYKGDLDAALAQAIKENAPLYQGDEARAMLAGYLVSDLYKRIPKTQLREQAFTLYAENDIVISGIIDCLAFNPDGSMLLVDYKTGKPPAADAVPEGYAYQLAIYEKVVRERWGRAKEGEPAPKISSELHFLRNNCVWCLPTAQEKSADYYAAALKLCTEISKKSAEKDFPCRVLQATQAEQNHTSSLNNVTEYQENIAQGVAFCSFCPYNYVCNRK